MKSVYKLHIVTLTKEIRYRVTWEDNAYWVREIIKQNGVTSKDKFGRFVSIQAAYDFIVQIVKGIKV